MELEKAGVVIYRHSVKYENLSQDTGVSSSATKTNKYVFVLHNTKDKTIKGQEILSQMENRKPTCVRCLHIQKKIIKLLQNVQTIKSNNVLSICDYCQLWDRRCCACEETKRKFYFRNNESKGNTKNQVKDWITEIKRLLQHSFPEEKKPEKERLRARSELRFDELRQWKPATVREPFENYSRRREPDIRDLFHDSESTLKLPIISEKSKTKTKFTEDNFFRKPCSVQAMPPIRDHYEADRFAAGRSRHESHDNEWETEYLNKTKDDQYIDDKENREEITATGYENLNDEQHVKRRENNLIRTKKKPSLENEFLFERKHEDRKPDIKIIDWKLNDDQYINKENNLIQLSKKPSFRKKKNLTPKQVDEKLLFDNRNNNLIPIQKKSATDSVKEHSSQVISAAVDEKAVTQIINEKKTTSNKIKKTPAAKPKKITSETKQSFSGISPKVKLRNKEIQNRLSHDSKTHEYLKTVDRSRMQHRAALKPSKRKEINVKLNKITVRKASQDDLILRLVKLKQSDRVHTDKKKEKISPKHFEILSGADDAASSDIIQTEPCPFCIDSDLQLDIECKKEESHSVGDIIWGQNIYKNKPLFPEHIEEEKEVKPLFCQKFVECIPDIAESVLPAQMTLEKSLCPDEDRTGVMHYALSDRTFIDKGWTMLPTEKIVRKLNVYRMRPSHPEFNWFERNKNKGLMHYDTGEELAQFDGNGRGRWYYKNGRLALDYYDAEEANTKKRFVIYSNGEPDERGQSRPYTILATFDYLGNGVVFDHTGKIRLKYNQTEGAVLDRNIGPESRWKWHTLNDPPVLQQVMFNTQMAQKDPDILKLGEDPTAHNLKREVNDEMLAIEFDNSIKEKSKKMSQIFKPFQIKTKALKINEHFSLKVLDQATIYLIFRDGMNHFKWNIGMILDHKEIVDTDTAEVGEVSNNLEKFPARTDSIAVLQKSVAHAQRLQRKQTQRERRLRPAEPCASADKLTAAASRPKRHPLRTLNSCTTTADVELYCKSKKPSSNNVFVGHKSQSQNNIM